MYTFSSNYSILYNSFNIIISIIFYVLLLLSIPFNYVAICSFYDASYGFGFYFTFPYLDISHNSIHHFHQQLQLLLNLFPYLCDSNNHCHYVSCNYQLYSIRFVCLSLCWSAFEHNCIICHWFADFCCPKLAGFQDGSLE